MEEYAEIKTNESLNEIIVYIEEFTEKNKTTNGIWRKVKSLIK